MKKLLASFFSIISLMFQPNVSFGQWMYAGAVNSFFSCTNGELKACGGNNDPHIGVPDTVSTYIQLPSTCTVANVIAVSSAGWNTLFLKNDGTVWAAGLNSYGQLGDGTTTNRSVPQPIPGLNNVIAIAAGGHHSIFLKSDSTVWGCGRNAVGCLGDGSNVDRLTPIQISSLTGVKAITCGDDYTIFLKGDGTVWATGYNNAGQIGVNYGANTFLPTQIDTLPTIVAISAESAHTIFLADDSTVWACGFNLFGSLGDGTTTIRYGPVNLTTLNRIVAIDAGAYHSLFLKYDGTVLGCGHNYNGPLGDGGAYDHLLPTISSGISNVINFSTGGEHSLFMKADGGVWGCGDAGGYQLGDGTNVNEPIPILLPTLSVQVTNSGPYFVCNQALFEIPVTTSAMAPISWFAIDNPNTSGETLLPQINDTITDSIYNGTVSLDTVVYFVTAQGCYATSAVEIDVIVNPHLVPADTLVNQSGTVLSANGIGDAYQWFDCTAQLNVTWATNNVFYPYWDGYYSLIITQQGCKDTSGCHYVFGVGIENIMHADEISVYPNPITDECTIQVSTELQNARLSIVDVHGRIVRNRLNVMGTNIYFRKENIESGMYMLILEMEGNLFTKKIIFE